MLNIYFVTKAVLSIKNKMGTYRVNTRSATGSPQGLCSKPELLHLFSHGHHTSLNRPCGAQDPQQVEMTIPLSE